MGICITYNYCNYNNNLLNTSNEDINQDEEIRSKLFYKRGKSYIKIKSMKKRLDGINNSTISTESLLRTKTFTEMKAKRLLTMILMGSLAELQSLGGETDHFDPLVRGMVQRFHVALGFQPLGHSRHRGLGDAELPLQILELGRVPLPAGQEHDGVVLREGEIHLHKIVVGVLVETVVDELQF